MLPHLKKFGPKSQCISSKDDSTHMRELNVNSANLTGQFSSRSMVSIKLTLSAGFHLVWKQGWPPLISPMIHIGLGLVIESFLVICFYLQSLEIWKWPCRTAGHVRRNLNSRSSLFGTSLFVARYWKMYNANPPLALLLFILHYIIIINGLNGICNLNHVFLYSFFTKFGFSNHLNPTIFTELGHFHRTLNIYIYFLNTRSLIFCNHAIENMAQVYHCCV